MGLVSEAKSIIDLANGIVGLGKAIKELRQGKKKPDLRLFFQDHIEPIYSQMSLIHKDYIEGFGSLLKCLREGKLPPIELYEWLEQRRRALQSERIDARNFGEELNPLNSKKSSLEIETEYALIEYVKSITEYFYAPDSLYQLSFYSDFAYQLKIHVQYANREDSKKMFKNFYETDFVKQFYVCVERAVNVSLPRNWNRISVAHHTLNRLLLS